MALETSERPGRVDRLKTAHATGMGYELQTSLMIGDTQGKPPSRVAQNLVTAKTVLNTYRPAARDVGNDAEPHLNELTERMRSAILNSRGVRVAQRRPKAESGIAQKAKCSEKGAGMRQSRRSGSVGAGWATSQVYSTACPVGAARITTPM